MAETLNDIIDEAGEIEKQKLRVFREIVNQDGHMNRMSSGDVGLYGDKENGIRRDLLVEAAKVMKTHESSQAQSLVTRYLEKMAEIVNGNPNWGEGFYLVPVNIQAEVEAVIVEPEAEDVVPMKKAA